MKELTFEQMENTQGGKFWGWGDWEASGPCVNGWQTFHRHYYALWATWDYDYNMVQC